MKRILPLILTVLLLPALLAVPARADEVTESGWINLMDYGGVNGGSGQSVSVPSGGSFWYNTPDWYVAYHVDIIIHSTENLTSASLFLDSLDNIMTPVIYNLGGGIYRLTLDFRWGVNKIGIIPSFSNNATSVITVLKFAVSTIGSIYRNVNATAYGLLNHADNFELKYTGTYVNTFWDVAGAGYGEKSFQINMVVDGNVHAYDFVDVLFVTNVPDISSISVDDTVDPLPFEISKVYEVRSPGEELEQPNIFVTLRIDVRGLESGYYPRILIGGVSSTSSNMFAISSVEGVLVLESPSEIAYWFSSLKLDVTNGFSSIGLWFAEQMQILRDGFGSVVYWGQSLKDSIDALPDKIAEALQDLVVPSDTAIQNFGDSSQQIAQDRFGGVYEGAMIVDEFAGQLQAQAATQILAVPVVNLDILGVPFPLGGWEVDLVPEGSEVIIEAVKLMIDIIATLAFINGIKSRLERTLEQ